MESIMTDKGTMDQPPNAGEGVESAEETAGTLDDVIARMDAEQQQPNGEVKIPDLPEDEPSEPEEAEAAAEDEEEDEAPDEESAGEEDDDLEEEHKSVFSEEAYKIFQQRIGKKNKQIERVRTELETIAAERDELKKTSDPSMQEAVAATGIVPEFLDAESAKTIAEAERHTRAIAWLEEKAADPDGYEDDNGNVFTPVQLLAQANKLSRESLSVLADARVARKAALARQQEAIKEGLKILNSRDKVKKALTPGEKKKKAAPAAPPVPSGANAAPEKPASVRDFRKTGDLDDLIDAI
jgi:hypothetical protein